MKVLLIVFIGLLFPLFSALAQEKPNVIIVFNDDQGYQDFGCFGSPDIKTPRTDALAMQGMRFTDFYVASSVCSASRTALLTGYHPYKTNVKGVLFPNQGGGLDTTLNTIADVMKSAEYSTAAIGKWHLGEGEGYLPTSRGFDYYYGIPFSNDMYPSKLIKYADTCVFREGYSMESLNNIFESETINQHKNKVPLMQNEECIEYPCDQTTITTRYTNESIKFIERSLEQEKPFFLYLANTMPHIPLFASEDFDGVSENGPYGDVIEEIDYNIGRLMDKLDELGISENTIVIVTSDNGPWLSVGKDKSGNADPFFEGKFTCFEGGMRVPFVIRWPEKIPAGTTNSEIASTLDILPTLANIVGIEVPNENIDGYDISPLWTGASDAKTPHEYYYYISGKGSAVRSGDWKYFLEENFSVNATRRPNNGPTLYNLKDDPGESVNLLKQYPEIADSLQENLYTFLAQIGEENREPRDTIAGDIPGKIEAELFSVNGGVQLRETVDEGGGQNVGWIDKGDYMLYRLNFLKPGNYVVDFRIASDPGNGKLQLEDEQGEIITTIEIPKTGGWQTWETISSDTIPLPQEGVHELKVVALNGGFNINWMEFKYIPEITTNNIQNNILKDELVLYPNPAKNLVEIQGIQDKEIEKVEVFDIHGSSCNIKWTNKSMDIENLKTGIYLINIKLKGNMIKTYRLVKE